MFLVVAVSPEGTLYMSGLFGGFAPIKNAAWPKRRFYAFGMVYSFSSVLKVLRKCYESATKIL